MTIQVGEKIPDINLKGLVFGEITDINTAEFFAKRKIVLFGVPGAFTPTCSGAHLPGFIACYEDLKKTGIDSVVCISVNDIFVMKAWSDSKKNDGKIVMLADGNAEFAEKTGLTLDARGFGMGVRSQRYVMIVNDGVIEKLKVEESAGVCSVSSADFILNLLL